MSPKQATPLTIEHALLGFLQDEALHGYELYQRLQAAQGLGSIWRLKQAHLYALLSKLEAAGLVQPVATARPGALPSEVAPCGRARRPLMLTTAGARAFCVWMDTPVGHGRDLRIEFLAKLFWAQREETGAAFELVTQQRVVCRRWLAEVDGEVQRLEDEHRYPRLVLLFRKGQIEATLGWLDTCAAMLSDTATPL